ncbi:hypothetical protein EC844_12669 [Acinetobacter calcoaceticus]|uniref:Uncharacterized protein n=1 Tax=Acinetobacter calcoaceticus TaxID=471 RepID=A0A4R1XJS8_ACICA|nr:hypothetical protein EC844_12669 [Acinetobacter calcoaceticus]
MQYLIELYTPTAQWRALSQADKQDFLNGVAGGMQSLSEYSIEAVSMGKIDTTVSNSSQDTFFAIWSFADQASRDALIAAITATGWHDYFKTLNAAGNGVDFPEHLGQLLAVN